MYVLVKQNESLYKVMFISIRDERHLITACRVTPTLSYVYRHALFGMACLSGTIRIVWALSQIAVSTLENVDTNLGSV